MKTLLWKELRENGKWAALGMLGLALAELFALYRPGPPFWYGRLVISGQTFELVTIYGGILIGAGLGALQIFPELDRDRWAALLHRPVSRTTLFLGKISAGLILYLLATGLPLLLSIACFALPGQFATPFVPGMLPAVMANAFLGVAFYALAVLVALTRGAWYGRRALLVLGLLPLPLIVSTSSLLFLPTLLTTGVLLVAAWGTMAGNGGVRRGWQTAELCLGWLQAVGCGLLFVCLLFLLNFLPGADTQGPASEYRNVVVTTDGQVLQNSYRHGQSVALRHLDGTPVTEEKYIGDDANEQLTDFVPLCQNLRSNLQVLLENQVGDPHATLNFLQAAYGDGSEGTEYWYYLVGKDYFVGYDKLTRRRIGICDREGFHPADQTPRPFLKPFQLTGGGYYSPRVGWLDNHLYRPDFPDRRLSILYTAPSGPIHAVTGLVRGSRIVAMAVALDTTVQILDLEGKLLVTIPYSHDTGNGMMISVATIPTVDRIFIQYAPPLPLGAPVERRSFVDDVDRQGHVLHSYTITNPPILSRPGWARYVALAGTPFAPTVLAAVTDVLSARKGDPSEDPANANSYSWRTWILFGAGLGLISAIITARWARAAGLTRRETLGWVIFTFCLGPVSVIAFRLTAHFPLQVRCPNCARQRPLQVEECPSGHQSWPAPASNGTEIFAELGC